MNKKILFLPLLSVVLLSCWGLYGRPYRNPVKVMGYKPVYSTDSSLFKVRNDTSRAIKMAGKIYTIGNYILQNEVGEGLHVIDKTDPAQLKNAGFIRIPGNTELSVKNGYLYVNSYMDLVVVDISNWKQVREVSRVKNAFAQGSAIGYSYMVPPPEHGVYYQCVNPYDGYQTGWVRDSVYDNDCFYP